MTKLISLKKYFSDYSFYFIFFIFLICSTALFIGVRKQTQSFHFEDETDHVAVGWMMSRFDKKLYTELSTNHQPFPILAGAILAKIVPYTTLFDLIERLRLSMFLYGTLWGLLLTIRFKYKGALSYALTYSIGYYFFAWHVLAESFATPAVICIFLLLYEKVSTSIKQTALFEKIDGILAGGSLTIIASCLLPLWPLCGLIGLGMIYFSKPNTWKYMIISGLTLTICIGVWFSPLAWFQETVMNNVLYFLPYTPKLTLIDWIKIAFFPFLAFLKPTDTISQTLLFPLVLCLATTTYFISKHKRNLTKKIVAGIYLYFLLVISNPRVLEFPTAFYQGFHLFPFIGAFFALIISLTWQTSNLISQRKAPVILSVALLMLFFFNSSWGRRQTDKLNEYYVQYGTQDAYARLISVFKNEGDTFFSGPNGFGFMNMRADIPIAGRQLFHLQWAYLSPTLKKEFHELMAEKPPTFIYFLEDQSGYHNDLQPILKEKYTEIVQNKHRTFLYFLNTKVAETTPAQKQYLEEQNFHFRTIEDGEIF